ncbi:MAG: hypothetical protein RL693_2757 [Verrucomicrobiota bacterium]
MNSKVSGKKRGCLIWLLFCVLSLISASIVMPSTIICGETGALSDLIGNTKNLIICVRLYAGDHGGKYPDTLQDLVKEGIIEQSALDKLLAHPTEGPKTPLQWIYLTGLSENTAPDYPVFISPVLKDDAGPIMRRIKALLGQRPRLPVKPVRVVAFSDTSVVVLKEADFQELINKHGIKLPATADTPEK